MAQVRGIDSDNYDGVVPESHFRMLHDTRDVRFNIIGLEARMPFADMMYLLWDDDSETMEPPMITFDMESGRLPDIDDLLTEATAVATTISQMSRSAARMAKEAVNRAFESPLAEGLLYERRLFHSAFATDDQSEGMAAFSEKRPPNFTHR